MDERVGGTARCLVEHTLASTPSQQTPVCLPANSVSSAQTRTCQQALDGLQYRADVVARRPCVLYDVPAARRTRVSCTHLCQAPGRCRLPLQSPRGIKTDVCAAWKDCVWDQCNSPEAYISPALTRADSRKGHWQLCMRL